MNVIRPEPLRRRTFVRVMLLAMMISATIGAWMMSRQWEQKQLTEGVQKLGQKLESDWEGVKLDALRPARNLCEEIDSKQITDAQAFAARAASFKETQDLYEGAYWIGPDGSTKAVAGTEDLDADLTSDPGAWKQLQHASNGKPIVGRVYEGAYGQRLVLVYYPLLERGGEGGVVGIIRLGRLMERFVDSQLRELVSLELVRNNDVLYRAGNYMASYGPQYRQQVHLRILDQTWTCQITPTTRFARQFDNQISRLVLALGLIGCLVAGGSVFSAMKRRWQHTMLEKGHLQIIDVIGELTRSISLSRGDEAEALRQIVETARPVTESDAVGVYQFTQDRKRLELVCSSAISPLKRTIELSQPAADSLRAVTEGRLAMVDHDRPESLYAFRLFDNGTLRSGVLAPLQLGRVIGVMLFGSSSGSAWSDGRVALVRLWASQAAALLGDEAVHAQMRNALSVQEKLARRREMMLTLLGEIYQAGTIEQTLGRIAQLSPHSLGVEACVVALRTRKEGELEIVAATGELGVRYFGLRLNPSGDQLVRMFKPDSVALVEPGDMEQAGFGQIAESWLAGLAAIPMLHSDGRPIGCLLLMSANQQAFTADQLDLARVLASRASAAIENAHLNQQIRRDAETRAMLLRELNHRVKNNLAGIVGLLSMSTNMEMPANVRQWLDRVTERIGNIARAHELFAGGVQAVSLQQLVEQVIPSLAVVKPPGVVIVKELGPSEIWLKTTHAVSLAMVIHELCYNAIVHGLGARGKLTIRAHVGENRNVILEIMDDGTAGTVQYDDDGGVATMAPPATSTGMGLRLVKGLVGRELRGRFTMRRRNEGGTAVIVEFPLDRDREDAENRR